MKLAKVALVIAMGLAGVSAAHAAEGNMGQGTGTVTFHGSIIDAPCSISPDTVDQTVEMGQIASAQLASQGSSAPVPFSIDLENCDVTTAQSAQVTFNGTVDANDSSKTMLGLNGTASGAGIVITDGSDVLPLGTASSAVNLSEGDNTLQFTAYLQGDDASSVVPGEFNSVANFAMSYN